MVVLSSVSDRSSHPKMARALELAALSPYGENPRVGCVIADLNGSIVGEGFHRGVGHPHAEVEALALAGDAARGGSAYVTLEPCAHTGRTGPCTQALQDAGVARVIFAQRDPNPLAAGGAQVLAQAGIEVLADVLADDAYELNREWSFAVQHQRPFVTLKLAASLDGIVANPDGSRRQLTGSAAVQDVHALRSRVGAIVVGTQTVMSDNPRLTTRGQDGSLDATQPLRVVVGMRDVPAEYLVMNDDAPTMQLRTHDVHEVLGVLWSQGVRHVLLEGGPTLAAAFIEAACVDEVWWYCAPITLGAGPIALAGVATTLAIRDVHTIGDDVRIIGTIRSK